VSTRLRAGDVLDVSEPRGAFILQRGDLPVVLLSGNHPAGPVIAARLGVQ
jgi:ferredoxin-NADP reductase